MQLVEHFISINGEGQRAGELALFLRFAGCNLQCDWCDTAWANAPDVPFVQADLQMLLEIARAASGEGVRNVTLTGGEPLLQKESPVLIRALCSLGMRVEIETNGSIPLTPFLGEARAVFTMDYKLPSSGMEPRMCTENIPLLRAQDTLKFVCASGEDLARAAWVLEAFRPACAVYLSPVFGRIEPAAIVDFMKARHLGNVRLQLQLHKFIWDPEKRGV
ncbi:MAG: putative 7-carboxy-7-deazaguanine synthase QueE [Oscillospiraceae bacterium]|nr:putative 7-carboxy-7-deazaguanine synthase QueE [Oscillospiraceae bacterium]